ncbi:MAG: extracellular solute-binding protein [Clostridia bacterium]|nr:extracellular solute-binding protein [Clostridia bacterium]
MMKKFLSKTLVFTLAFLMVFSCFGPIAMAETASAVGGAVTGENKNNTKLEEIRELLNSNEYAEYRLLHASAPNGVDDIVIKGADYNKTKSTATVYTGKYLGSTEDVALFTELGDVTWDFVAEHSGNYHISITYAPIVDYDGDGDGKADLISNAATIKRALLLDGSYPFKQSRYIELARIWKDELGGEGSNDRGFILDNDGNEVKPNKVEAPEWRTVFASDSTGYVTEPFLYYIEAGSHTISLAEVQETCAIKEIRIYYDDSSISYDEYLAKHEGLADNSSKAEIGVIEAEIAHRTSSNIVYPVYDRSSAASMPQSAYNIYLNSIGGEKWQNAGQWISWQFEVKEDGFYNLSPRFLQSFAEGMYVTRELKIDGETPFEEAKQLRFKYGEEWQLLPLTDGVIDPDTQKERALEFYFTAGTHTIEMWVVLGEMASVLTDVELSLAKINEYYLQILMLTGSEPDEYRDYQFARLMPDVIKGLGAESKRLSAIVNDLVAITGTKGSDSMTLETIAMLLDKMYRDEDEIAPNFSELKDYIGSLGTWIMTARNQPLQFDYILVTPADAANELGFEKYYTESGYKAEAGFWQALAYEFEQFIMSWVSDYSSYGVRTAEGSENYARIEVWTTSGRDQSTIIRSIVSDSFTKQHNIAVDLKLVAAGSLMPATLSGSGPDINMSMASSTIINYAIRSAVLPINPAGYAFEEDDTAEERAFKEECQRIFSDYDQVVSWFDDAATVPLELYGVAYGLPETESFSMLFYRSDILLELDLEIPETWDDVYNMLPTLQTNNLDFGYHESLAGLLIMLYQRGEQLYSHAVEGDTTGKTEGMGINLSTNAALETFKDMCELYTMYGFPYSYNFVNRFRTGEMPIGVQAYTTYSQLTIFAPELRGLWGFTVLPGTIRTDENGKTFVDHTADTNVAGIVMMNDCEEIEAAWSFMKWWVSADAQSTYGQEYYALLGASGQYATANLEALYAMSWTADERAEIQNQFEWLQATPEMPGGYIVSRYVEFAFLAAYNSDEDPVESMLEYIDSINAELTRKRSEFDLPTLENYEEYLANNA